MSNDGELCVPLPGLFGVEDRFDIGGLTIERLDYFAWRAIENLRTTDMYTDEYQALPRYFLVEPTVDVNDPAEWERVGRAASQLVFSMLLCGPGDLIAPHHATIVGRSSTGMNLRRQPDRTTSRFLAVTFGGDWPVFDTGRKLHGLGGEMYVITPDRATTVDEMIDVVRQIEARAETDPTLRSVLAAGHNFSQSRSFLLAPRVRFVALFAAIEILLGEFGPVGERPGLGHLLTTFHVPGEEREEVGDELESQLRTVRNQTIHGGVGAGDLITFLDGLIPLVQPLVRATYILALGDDRARAARRALHGRTSAQAGRVLRSLLGAAYRGSSEADDAIVGLELRAAHGSVRGQ